MKVWCARQQNKDRVVFATEPTWHENGVYAGYWGSALTIIWPGHREFLNGIFPRGIKPGECKQVTIKRWEVDDG